MRGLLRREFCAAGLLTASASASASAIATRGEALNKAGAQRMLSQRMGKAWLALALQVRPQQAQDVLNQSVQRFELQLAQLQDYAPTPALQSAYAELARRYAAQKALMFEGAPNAARAADLVARANTVLQQAHQATGLLESWAARPAARLVNLAGRQRMLSQRMAMVYLAGGPTTEIAQARGDFLKAHAALRDAAEATPGIREGLALAEQQWVFLDLALTGATAPERGRADVFTASENLLTVMERVTRQYAEVSG